MTDTKSNAKHADAPVWDLSRIFKDATEIEAAKVAMTEAADQLATAKGNLKNELYSKSAAKFLFDQLDKVGETGSELICYFRLASDADTADKAKQKDLAAIEKFCAANYSKIAYFESELSQMDISVADLFPEHARYWARDIIEGKKHQMTPELEEYSTDMAMAPDLDGRLFDKIISELRFHKGMTLMEAYDALGTETKRSQRRKIHDSITKGLNNHLDTFALMFNCRIAKHAVKTKWRNYDSPAGLRHDQNRVTAEDVEALRSAVVGSYATTSHPYYKWKAAKIGRPKGLRPWDLSMPTSAEDLRQYTWNEAKDITLECLYGFSERMGDCAAELFDKKTIDARPAAAKRIGGYCQPVSGRLPSYILMSWMGTIDDVETLVHEAGHAAHFRLSQDLGYTVGEQCMPMTMAETASVFAEMLLFEWRLKNAKDESERADIIAGAAGAKIHTCQGTIATHNFEVAAYAEHASSGELTPERLNELWMQAESDMIGPALIGAPALANRWAKVLHCVKYQFYCYSYAWGDCLVNCLWQGYKDGRVSVEAIEHLLATGHSKPWKWALREAGLEPDDPGFWQGGIKVIEDLVSQLKV